MVIDIFVRSGGLSLDLISICRLAQAHNLVMPHLYNFFFARTKGFTRKKKFRRKDFSVKGKENAVYISHTTMPHGRLSISFELCVKFLCYNIPKLNKEESESIGGSLTKAEVLKIRNN